MNPTIHWPEKPIYFIFNINQEQIWNQSKAFPSVTQSSHLELIQRQEVQLLFTARPCDTVLFLYEPNRDFMRYLISFGLQLPKIRVISGLGAIPWDDIHKEGACLVPYIMTEEIEMALNQCSIDSIFSQAGLIKKINNKFYTRSLVESHNFRVTTGRFCLNIEELKEAYAYLTLRGFEKKVLKIPYGSSGKGLKVIKDDRSFELLCKYIQKRADQFEMLLEGWHPIRRSINCQLWIDENSAQLLAFTEQYINEDAVYIGTDYTPDYDEQTLLRYQYEMERLGKVLLELGYRGLAGVDSIIDTKGDLFPVIEINARFTQVTYLLTLIERFKRDFQFISTKWINFSRIVPTCFDEVLQKLNEQLTIDTFIYTYAETNVDQMHYYRLFIIFMSNDCELLKQNLDQVNNIYLEQEVS